MDTVTQSFHTSVRSSLQTFCERYSARISRLASMLERPPMVPLTDAWLQHWPGGQRRRSWIGTMVFNRELSDSIRLVSEEELELGLLVPRNLSRS